MGIRRLTPAARAVTAPPAQFDLTPLRVARVRTTPRRPGHFALAAVAALVGVWAFAPFVLVAVDAAIHHRVFLGVSGYYPNDGLQYLAWVRDAQNGLVRNLYGSAKDHAFFIHPMWTPSGFAEASVHVGPAAVMAFWKAVSTVVLVAGCVRLVTRHIGADRPGVRCTALILALFGGLTPLAALLAPLDVRGESWGDFTRAAFELTPAVTLWDYAPLAIALGLIPFMIERVERLLNGERDRRLTVTTALMGMLVAWLHPWQGETLIAICVGLAGWRWARQRPERWFPSGSLVCVIAATAAPILYYLSLSLIDAGWAAAERNNVAVCLIPWPVFVCGVLPLAAIVPLAGRGLLGDGASLALVLWPAAQILSVAVSHSGQYRAIDGLVMPIAVLAVKAWSGSGSGMGMSRRRRMAAGLVLLSMLAPCAVFAVDAFRKLHTPAFTQYAELAPSDVRATRLAARFAGGEAILAPIELGTAIPVLTDAPSWLGHLVWTPDVARRRGRTMMLFRGGLAPSEARALLESARSRALVEPCGWPGQLGRLLGPLGFREIRVGCATVYLRTGRS
jgi:hypothetical protein